MDDGNMPRVRRFIDYDDSSGVTTPYDATPCDANKNLILASIKH